MPNWKKLITSGSSASLYNLVADNHISASLLSGSFYGDGSNLTGVGFPYTGAAEISGSLRVTGGNISGSFIGNGSGLTGIDIGEVQSVSAEITNVTSSIITHNFGSNSVLATVYDENNFQIIPKSVQLLTTESLEVTFSSASSGTVVVSKGGHIVTGSVFDVGEATTVTASFSNTLSETFSHTFGTKNVLVQVYDDADNLIIPKSINTANTGSVSVTFSTGSSGRIVIAKGGHFVTGSQPLYGEQITNIGDITLSGSLFPQTTEVFDLGSSSKRWRDLYLSGSTIYLDTTRLTLDTNGDIEIKDHTNNRKRLVVDQLKLGQVGDTPIFLSQHSGSLLIHHEGSTDPINLTTSPTSAFTGSFTGSFIGDGTQLTGVTSYTDADTLSYINSLGVVSGSTTTEAELNTATSSLSASLATDIAALDSTTVKLTGNQSIDGDKTFNNDIYLGGTLFDSDNATYYLNPSDSSSLNSATYIGSTTHNDNVESYFGSDTDVKLVYIPTSNEFVIQNDTNDSDINLNTSTTDGTVTTGITLGGTNQNVQLNFAGNTKLTTVSTGVNVTGAVTASNFLGTGSIAEKLTAGNKTVQGDLNVTGTITAQEFNTEYVSSSILFESGSTVFGNSADDTHQFTGSVSVDGTLAIEGITNVSESIAAAAASGGGGGSATSVSDTFTNTNTKTVTHGFGTKDVVVQVYNDSDEQIIPLSVTTSTTSSVDITFNNPISGRVVLSRGGHVLEATTAVTYNNVTGKPFFVDTQTGITSGSVADVLQVSTSSYSAAIFDYSAYSGSNARAGSVTAVCNGTTISYNEVSTGDIGDTTPLTLSVALSGGNFALQALSSTTGWTVKSHARGI